MRAPYWCIEASNLRSGQRGATYGGTKSYADAVAALERGRARGASWGKIVERRSLPKGMSSNLWLPPFDERKAGFR